MNKALMDKDQLINKDSTDKDQLMNKVLTDNHQSMNRASRINIHRWIKLQLIRHVDRYA